MKIYIYALVAVAIMGIGNYLGNEYLLYFVFPPYDIFMHIIGGTGIGLAIIAVSRSLEFNIHRSIRIVVFLVFLVGLVWELFEAYYNIAGAPVGTKAYYIDTIKDLFDDIVGGTCAFLIARKKN
jgi:hypothetical protein